MYVHVKCRMITAVCPGEVGGSSRLEIIVKGTLVVVDAVSCLIADISHPSPTP